METRSPGDAPTAAQQAPAGRTPRWFGMPARRFIVLFLAVYAAGTLAYRVMHTEDPHARFMHLIGQPYTEFAFYFGAPEKEESDGREGVILFYDDVAVSGDRFVESPFRVYLDPRGRIYLIEFD